jgi:hypothetical protein
MDARHTMGCEMAIRFKYGGVSFTADTPEEAAQTMALLKERDAETSRQRSLARVGGRMEQLRASISEEAENPWTPAIFQSFIDRLGKPQQDALALLVTFRHVTDEELRASVDVPGNQALAGVLSGISKQAAALNIPPRDVFSFQNLRNGGKRRSTYTVSDKFLEIATQNNWPGPHQFPLDKQSQNNT